MGFDRSSPSTSEESFFWEIHRKPLILLQNEPDSSYSSSSSPFAGVYGTNVLLVLLQSGERVPRAYEKKYMQLGNQDVKGDDPFAVDKTRTTIRDLYTQNKVSRHSFESISKRIETLCDQELLPQLLELVEGLTKRWKVMAESHQIQKRTLAEAKVLLAGTPTSKRHKKRQPSIMHEVDGDDGLKDGYCSSRSESSPRDAKSRFLVFQNYLGTNLNSTQACADNSSPLIN